MNSLSIRAYRPGDEEDVIRLWTECRLVVPQNHPGRDIRRKLKVNPEWFLVGETEGKLVSTCMAGYEGHRGWINYLAVSPPYRRRGIAAGMMKEAERLLKSAGCPKINLQIRSSNLGVIAFYERIGYAADDVVSMGKRLDRDPPHSDVTSEVH
jgi:ribosomal protein S18 acetylase RimI-like enzyme